MNSLNVYSAILNITDVSQNLKTFIPSIPHENYLPF